MANQNNAQPRGLEDAWNDMVMQIGKQRPELSLKQCQHLDNHYLYAIAYGTIAEPRQEINEDEIGVGIKKVWIEPEFSPQYDFAFTLLYKKPQTEEVYWWGVELAPRNPFVFIHRTRKPEQVTRKP